MIADYSVIVVFAGINLLSLYNIWSILYKQKEYKNLPILVFYVFTQIALTLRMIYTIFFWMQNVSFLSNLGFVYQFSKICVGVAQDWITVELAFRIRNSRSHTTMPEWTKRRLIKAQYILFAITFFLYTCYVTAVLVTSRLDGNNGIAFERNLALVVDILSYTYLLQAIVMISLVIWLLYETKLAVKREMLITGRVQHPLRKERRIYALITTVFAISYIGRFIFD